MPVGGCGAVKLRCWDLAGAVRARVLHCCFCINMAVLGAHGGPGEGAGRPPPLFACLLATAAAANMAGP